MKPQIFCGLSTGFRYVLQFIKIFRCSCQKKNPHFFRVSSFFSLMILAKKFGNFFQTKQKTTAQSLTSVRCKYLLYYFLLETTIAAPASAARPILMPIAASVLGFVVLLGFVVVFDDEAAAVICCFRRSLGR